MKPEYNRIGMTFKVGKQQYYGTVTASVEALYLIMAQRRNDFALAAGVAGGLIGGLIVGAITAMGSKKSQPVRTCKLEELGTDITSHPDWPVPLKPRNSDTEVLVIPRDAVDVIKHQSFTNLLQFNLADTPVTIEYLLLRGKRVQQYLLDAGWRLNWKGRLLGTTAPVG